MRWRVPWFLIALLPFLAVAQVWERPVREGMVFRMEVVAEPRQTIYGVRIDPRMIVAESHLARKETYDSTPTNGRATLSEMVTAMRAIGGVNGDFFQWGQDPGGSPEGLHVRNGELLSAPNTGAGRDWVIGWGDGPPMIRQATWTASAVVNGSRLNIQGLNRRINANELVLFTDASNEAYATQDPVYVIIQAGPYRLRPVDTLRGTVHHVNDRDNRISIRPGTFVIGATGARADALRSLSPGTAVEVTLAVTGFDWSTIRDAMGGGPVLLRNGENVVDRPNDPRHPRTAVGVDAEGRVWYVIVDGRQPTSVGSTLPETADIMKRWGCVDAFNLDGGGSSTLNIFGLIANRPSAGSERTVANAILWYSPPTLWPDEPGAQWTLSAPPVRVGTSAIVQLSVDGRAIPADRLIWACVGAAWIDQDGRMHGLSEGKATITVLYMGRLRSFEIEVQA